MPEQEKVWVPRAVAERWRNNPMDREAVRALLGHVLAALSQQPERGETGREAGAPGGATGIGTEDDIRRFAAATAPTPRPEESGDAAGRTKAGDCTRCGGPVYHRRGYPGEFDHDCPEESGEGEEAECEHEWLRSNDGRGHPLMVCNKCGLKEKGHTRPSAWDAPAAAPDDAETVEHEPWCGYDDISPNSDGSRSDECTCGAVTPPEPETIVRRALDVVHPARLQMAAHAALSRLVAERDRERALKEQAVEGCVMRDRQLLAIREERDAAEAAREKAEKKLAQLRAELAEVRGDVTAEQVHAMCVGKLDAYRERLEDIEATVLAMRKQLPGEA